MAHAMAAALQRSGIPAVVVPEYLRIWCDTMGRLPALTDQPEILHGQLAAEDAAAHAHPGAILLCDPAAITTPLYSKLYFGEASEIDTSLLSRYEQLIWCDIDIAWTPDPMRDSPHMRLRMHELIAESIPIFEAVQLAAIPLVSGTVQERIRQAWQPYLPINSP